jgi:hypothetical protein
MRTFAVKIGVGSAVLLACGVLACTAGDPVEELARRLPPAEREVLVVFDQAERAIDAADFETWKGLLSEKLVVVATSPFMGLPGVTTLEDYFVYTRNARRETNAGRKLVPARIEMLVPDQALVHCRVRRGDKVVQVPMVRIEGRWKLAWEGEIRLPTQGTEGGEK